MKYTGLQNGLQCFQGIIDMLIRVTIQVANHHELPNQITAVTNQQRDQGHYKVSLNHVLANLLTESDDLLFGEVLGDLVVEIEVQEDLT